MNEKPLTFFQYCMHWRCFPFLAMAVYLAVSLFVGWMLGELKGNGVPLLVGNSILFPPLFLYINWRMAGINNRKCKR